MSAMRKPPARIPPVASSAPATLVSVEMELTVKVQLSVRHKHTCGHVRMCLTVCMYLLF